MRCKKYLESIVLSVILLLILAAFCYNTIQRQELVAEMKRKPFDIREFKGVDTTLTRLEVLYGGVWVTMACVLIHRVSSKTQSMSHAFFALFASYGLACLLVACLWQLFSYPKTLIYMTTFDFLRAIILFCIPFCWSWCASLVSVSIGYFKKRKDV